jgi:hypothetical protein
MAICLTPHRHTSLSGEEELALPFARQLGEATEPGGESVFEFTA